MFPFHMHFAMTATDDIVRLKDVQLCVIFSTE